jgi:phosphoglycerate dehydrogenase-like enzyme
VPAAALREIADAEVYFGFGIAPALFRAARSLRWVHSAAAGVRASLFPEMCASDVVLTNSAGVYADPLAEWAIGAMLHFARGFDVALDGMRRGDWPHPAMASGESPLRELTGSTVCVVGYGGIGRAIGMRARALGMRVLAVRAHPGRTLLPEVDEVHGPGALDALLPRADYVVLALPETDGTRGSFDAAAFDRMRPDAVLMNLSRGGIVDEVALVEALRGGRLRGAALDVFQTEPLPADSPMRSLPNVLPTPHAGAISPAFWNRQGALMIRNLRKYLAGEPLENRVDKERGY